MDDVDGGVRLNFVVFGVGVGVGFGCGIWESLGPVALFLGRRLRGPRRRTLSQSVAYSPRFGLGLLMMTLMVGPQMQAAFHYLLSVD